MYTKRPDDFSKDPIIKFNQLRAIYNDDPKPSINIYLLIPHLLYNDPNGVNPELKPKPHSHPKEAKDLVERFIEDITKITGVAVESDGYHYMDISYGRWSYNFWGSPEKLVKVDMIRLNRMLIRAKKEGYIADYEAWRELR